MNQKIVVTKPGGTDCIKIVQEPEPTPGNREVKIRILACGVAYGDVMLRKGIGIRASAFPVTPGYDLCGVVEQLGPGASSFSIGERVAAFPVRGSYQQFICLPEKEVLSIPQNIPAEEVVSVILNYTTAYQMLTRVAALRAGQTALIHGAAGGVGTAMLQLAQLQGIKVYGTVSEGKADLVAKLGGMPIDYKKDDFVTKLRAMEPKGVDAVFDPVGGPHLMRSYRVLAPGGTLVWFGASAAGASRFALAGTISRFLALKLRLGTRRAVFYGIPFAKKKHPDQFKADVAVLMAYLGDHKIKPIIAAVMPLSEAAEAQALLESSGVAGKIVLQP